MSGGGIYVAYRSHRLRSTLPHEFDHKSVYRSVQKSCRITIFPPRAAGWFMQRDAALNARAGVSLDGTKERPANTLL